MSTKAGTVHWIPKSSDVRVCRGSVRAGVRGLGEIEAAYVVVCDRLAPPAVLDWVGPGTGVIHVGKIPRGEFTAQEVAMSSTSARIPSMATRAMNEPPTGTAGQGIELTVVKPADGRRDVGRGDAEQFTG